MPEEMYLLRNALTARQIEWVNESDNLDRSFPFLNLIIYRTKWIYNGHKYSVLSGYGTWGGEQGLLEMIVDNEEPQGSLTALDVLTFMDKETEE